jgi:hypothetical protein
MGHRSEISAEHGARGSTGGGRRAWSGPWPVMAAPLRTCARHYTGLECVCGLCTSLMSEQSPNLLNVRRELYYTANTTAAGRSSSRQYVACFTHR